MKIDVCIPTLNAAKTLATCLYTIKKIIPYNRLLIVDGFSNDGTVAIAEALDCNIYQCKGKLGEARNKLIKLVETEWFVFIDSDVLINQKWWDMINNNIDDKTGAINGFGLPNSFLLSNFRKTMLLAKLRLGIKQRGFTSNTLIRTEAVKGIKLPDLKRTEDIILQEEVEKRGWKWKMVPAWCLHMKTASQILLEAKNDFFEIAKREGYLKALKRL